MITREWLDTHLPTEGVWLMSASAKIAGALPLEDQLAWLAQLQEGDFFPRPPWKAANRAEMAWPIRIDGVVYKGSDSYLTSEGWPLRTRCWFVTIECGWRYQITAETPEAAVQRAVIVAHAARIWRDTDPAERSSFADTVIELAADITRGLVRQT